MGSEILLFDNNITYCANPLILRNKFSCAITVVVMRQSD
jgi:hypothetical protein